jgi:hypothetical protein
VKFTHYWEVRFSWIVLNCSILVKTIDHPIILTIWFDDMMINGSLPTLCIISIYLLLTLYDWSRVILTSIFWRLSNYILRFYIRLPNLLSRHQIGRLKCVWWNNWNRGQNCTIKWEVKIAVLTKWITKIVLSLFTRLILLCFWQKMKNLMRTHVTIPMANGFMTMEFLCIMEQHVRYRKLKIA